MDNKKTGEFISNLRKSRNLTQKDLADQLGITDKAVSKWERGAGYPDISMLRPLATILGTTVNELLEGEASTEVTDTDTKKIDTALNYVDQIITLKKNKLGRLLATILSSSLFLAIFTCVIVNFAVELHLTWSIIVIDCCLFGGCLFLPPLLSKKRGIIISLCLLSVLILPFLGVLEMETQSLAGYGGWLWKLGFPISLIWIIILWLMLLLKRAPINIWFYIGIGAIISIPGSFLTNYIVDQFMNIDTFEVSRRISSFSTVVGLLMLTIICFAIGFLRRGRHY